MTSSSGSRFGSTRTSLTGAGTSTSSTSGPNEVGASSGLGSVWSGGQINPSQILASVDIRDLLRVFSYCNITKFCMAIAKYV